MTLLSNTALLSFLGTLMPCTRARGRQLVRQGRPAQCISQLDAAPSQPAQRSTLQPPLHKTAPCTLHNCTLPCVAPALQTPPSASPPPAPAPPPPGRPGSDASAAGSSWRGAPRRLRGGQATEAAQGEMRTSVVLACKSHQSQSPGRGAAASASPGWRSATPISAAAGAHRWPCRAACVGARWQTACRCSRT